MRKQILTLATIFTIFLPSFSMAASLTGYVAYTGDPVYSVTSTDLQYPDGTPYSDLPVLLICIDHTTQPPFNVPTSFFSEAGTGAIKGSSGVAGIAAIHWLLEQYYETYYKNGTGQQQRALQYALWEIGNDYDGSAGSINASLGQSRPGNNDDVVFPNDPAFITAYQTLYQAMVTALPKLPTTYRSTTYTLDLFKNQDPQLQNMVALIERAPPNVVPTAVPSISGITQVGSAVTGTYTYADSNSDIENPAATTYQFVTSPNPIIANSSEGTTVANGITGGASASVSYTLQPADLNKYLYFCVTPAARTGATPGLEVCSVAVGPVANTASPHTPRPVPGLGQWALMVLTAILALFGIATVRPRRN